MYFDTLLKLSIYSNLFVMSQENLVQLKNKDTKEVYWTRRNKKITDSKLELNKFSKKLKKVIPFKQTKK